MICPRCHKENRAQARFCDECGFELPTIVPIAREMFGGSDDASGSAAPTADLNGIDRFVNAGYEEEQTSATVRLDEDASVTVPFYGSTPGIPAGSVDAPYPYPDATVPFTSVNTAQAPTQSSMYGRNFFANQDPFETSSGATGSSKKAKKDSSQRRRTLRNILIACLCAVALIGAAVGITYGAQLWGGKVVPNVLGMTESEAVAALEGNGFKVKTVKVRSDDVEGIVLGSDPAAGSRVDEGSEIVIDVSIARLIPEVIGMTEEEALALLDSEGFTNIELTVTKSNEAESTVLSVTPASGTRSKADTLITLEVAEPFRVPDVAGMPLADAQSTLENEGYIVEVAYAYEEDIPEGNAIGTDPAAGSALDSGSTVTLRIAKHRSTELVNKTRAFFTDSPKFTVNGQPYELKEVTSVSYGGNGVCDFTIVARPYETHSWFGVQAETRYGNYETITGSITWAENDTIASIEPSIKQD